MKRRSPLFHVDRIEDPLMIVQGANDPRVTKRESDQMALALRDRGIDVQYLVAENEGHGFANADNRMALYRAMEEFFGECLEGRVQEEVPAAIEEQIAKLSVDVDTLTLEAEVSYREVGVADPLLDPSWIHEDSQQVRLTLVQGGQEREIGSSTQSVAFTEVDGRPAIRKVDTVESPMIGSTADTALVDRETLAPLSLRSHNPNRTAALEFDGARLSGSVQPASGEARMIDETFDATPFLTETVGLAVRALRLEEGLAVELPVYLTDQGTTGTAKVVVTGVESVEVEGRPVEAWVVQSTIAGQEITTWLARDDHRQLKSLVTIAPGVELRVERM